MHEMNDRRDELKQLVESSAYRVDEREVAAAIIVRLALKGHGRAPCAREDGPIRVANGAPRARRPA